VIDALILLSIIVPVSLILNVVIRIEKKIKEREISMKVFRVVREFEHYGEDIEFIVVAENEEQAIKLAGEEAFYYESFGPVKVSECDLNTPKVLLNYTKC